MPKGKELIAKGRVCHGKDKRIIRTLTRDKFVFSSPSVCWSVHSTNHRQNTRFDKTLVLLFQQQPQYVQPSSCVRLNPTRTVCALWTATWLCESKSASSPFEVASTLSTRNAPFLSTIVRLLEEPFHKGNPVFTLLPLVSLVESSGRAVVRLSKVGDGAVKESRRLGERRKR